MKQYCVRCLAILSLSLIFIHPKAEGFSPSIKGLGIAATGTAYPQDAESGAYNPANITWVGNRVDIGISDIRTDGETIASGFTLPQENGTFKAFNKHYFYNPHFGITKQICCRNKHFAAGLVVYNNEFAYSQYNKPFPVIGTSPVRLSFIQEIIAPQIAFEFSKGHTIGVSLDIIVQRFKLNGVENFDNAAQSTAPGYVTNKGPSLASGVGVTIGYLGQFANCLKIGVAYSPEVHMSHFHRYKGFFAQKGKINKQQKIAGGVALNVHPKLVWAMDIVHEAYNQLPALHNPLKIPAELGADDGAGFAWRDRLFIRTGFVWSMNDKLDLRLGYRHARSGVPPYREAAASNVLLMELIQDFITTGFTYRFSCNKELSFFYGHGFRHSETLPVPVALNPPFFLPGAELNLSQSQDAFGFSLGLCY